MQEWQKHVLRNTAKDPVKTAWCGQPLWEFDWSFQSIDHMAFSLENGDRLLPCPECLLAIQHLLGKE